MNRSEKHWSEIEVDPQEGRDLINRYLKLTTILTSRIWSKHRRARPSPPLAPEVKVSTPADCRETGEALCTQFLERAGGRCDCYSCRSQNTKSGIRERSWISAVALAYDGDPSTLVELLRSKESLSRLDRNCLAELLDAAFGGEVEAAMNIKGRPKHIAAHACASIALKFYADWKAVNRRLNVSDRGVSDAMKDEACRVALQGHKIRQANHVMLDHPMNVVPTFEEVRELMDRPRGRRR